MKRILVLLYVVVVSHCLLAAPISLQQAKKLASQWALQSGKKSIKEAAISSSSVRKMRGKDAALYVFNVEDNGGFVIVSADDRTLPILGYTESGEYDDSNLPDNMRAWMKCYVEQIEALPADYVPQYSNDDNCEDPTLYGPRRAPKAAVPFFVTTRWNQGDPYNLDCPMDGNQHSVTGCTATAMAQCMNYVRWPLAATTSIPSYFVLDQWLPELPSTVFDWNNMLNEYSVANDTQRSAVAKLMRYCGQAIQMGYSATGSGAALEPVKTALLDYFNYDGIVEHVHRSEYSIATWDALIYNEVYNKRPVLYAGYAPGGHAFVCDGYDGQGFYHINWGWGGWRDGFFKLSVLDPDDNSGIGAASTSGGYSMGQECIIGIQKQMGTPRKRVGLHTTINDITIEGPSINANYINWTGETHSFDWCIVMQNGDGSLTPISEIAGFDNLGANYYIPYRFNLEGRLNPGTYKISPASKLKSDSEWVPAYNFNSKYIIARVASDRSVTLTMYPHEELGACMFDVVGSRMAGQEQKVEVTVVNKGDEFYKTMALYASRTNEKGDARSITQLVVPEGGTEKINLFFTPEQDGIYNLWMTEEHHPENFYGYATVRIGGRNELIFDNATNNGFNDTEHARKLFDGNTDSKWCFFFGGTETVIFHAQNPIFVSGYRIATGGDTEFYPSRNPRSWTLYGSTSNSLPSAGDASWEVISQVDNDKTIAAYNQRYYTFEGNQTSKTKAYKYFKYVLRGIEAGKNEVCQISEIELLNDINVELAHGADAAVLPSFKWGGNYSAYTCEISSGRGYNDSEYNKVMGTPEQDAAGRHWYDYDYTLSGGSHPWLYGNSVLPKGWSTNMGDVYARRYFTVDGTLPETLFAVVAHDDAPCEYYINGVKVWGVTDGWEEGKVIYLTPEQKALIKTDGTLNVFAYHVHQNWGGVYADGGLYGAGGPVDNFRENVTISSAQYATYVAPFSVKTLPEGLSAYVAQDMQTHVHLEPITEIPAGQAVVLHGNQGTYAIAPSSTPATMSVANDLVWSAEDIKADGSQYILAQKQSGVGFYPVIVNTTIKARKGYLVSPANVNYFGFDLEDDETHINVSSVEDTPVIIYNLQGQMLHRAQKGINIINGIKVFVK